MVSPQSHHRAAVRLAALKHPYPEGPNQCEDRPGIGLCDECGKPRWPQIYVGYGCMVCLDCLNGGPS